MKNNKLQLSANIIDRFDRHTEKIFTCNFFSNKNVLLSENVAPSINQKIGDLGGVSINGWKDEWNSVNVFIISNADYDNLCQFNKSDMVTFIENHINKAQTQKDVSAIPPQLSSKLYIIKEKSFLYLVENRTKYSFFIDTSIDKEFRVDIFKRMQQSNILF